MKFRNVQVFVGIEVYFKFYYSKLDVHEFVHRDTTTKITNKMHYID
jgi:hypothetical protein